MMEFAVTVLHIVSGFLKHFKIFDFRKFVVAHGVVPASVLKNLPDPARPTNLAELHHLSFWNGRTNEELSSTLVLATTAAAHTQAAFDIEPLVNHWAEFVSLQAQTRINFGTKAGKRKFLNALQPYDSIAARFLAAVGTQDPKETFPRLSALEAEVVQDCPLPRQFLENAKEEIFQEYLEVFEDMLEKEDEIEELRAQVRSLAPLPSRVQRDNTCTCKEAPTDSAGMLAMTTFDYELTLPFLSFHRW
ncbi:hypothetical protein CF327_g7738 [Tilletia walkeri]|nr:hypothetical protein CF327_g7738 [Tilletia walkeri]